jgi:excisionase family DNA binding protein
VVELEAPAAVSEQTPDRSADRTRWVSLARACVILGVNQSTIRRWADSGEIRSYRTPGGHRRLAEADLVAMTREQRQGPELESAAVNRIRRQLHSGHGDPDWYSSIAADGREALRTMGRRLLALVTDYIERRRPRAVIEREVDAIGHDYGSVLQGRGTSLLSAMQAFTFFRRSLDETAKQLATHRRMDADEAARTREEIAALADRVLLGVAAAYDAEDADYR